MDKLLDRYDALGEEEVRLRIKLADVVAERRAIRDQLGKALNFDPRPEAAEPTPPADDVIRLTVAAVKNLGGRADAAMVSDMMKISRGVVRTRLGRAVDAGLLERRERGIYVVPGFPFTASRREASQE